MIPSGPKMLTGVLAAWLSATPLGAIGEEKNVNPSWNSVSIGVADLEQALELWVEALGFETADVHGGDDADLARLWGLEPGDIARQALLRTPGQSAGMMHLVQFSRPQPPVRLGAEVFDLCPKNLDIYVSDLPARHRELLARGFRFRTQQFSDVTAPNGVRFREIHMPSHDEINVVLLELLGAELPFNELGYAGVGPLITIVDDASEEKLFYSNILELDILSDNLLEGKEIEKMIGLPPGSALDVSIWGRQGHPLGQLEIIDYRGVEGRNLYPRARPPALGILHVSYRVEDLDALVSKLDRSGLDWTGHGEVETLAASGRAIHFFSPSGLRIEAFSD